MDGKANIRVLHIIDHLGLGGAQTFLLDLVRNQKEDGWVYPTVCCLTERTNLSDKFEQSGIKINHLNVGRHNILQVIIIPIKLYYLMKSQNLSLVHTHLFVSGFFGRLAAKFNQLPNVVHEQRNETEEIKYLERILELSLGKITSAVICVSESTKKFVIGVKGISPEKIWVIPNGISVSRLNLSESNDQTRILIEELNFTDIDQIVIGVGRLEPEKRFDIFIKAAKRIQAFIPKIGFLIVGEGPERTKLESLSNELNLNEVVRFTGFRSDVESLMSISDVFMLTSDYEGLPLTILEAMLMQVPVVASAVDGNLELLGDGKGGILVPRREPTSFADEVIALMQNEDRRKNLGLIGRQWIIERYSIYLVREQIDEVYKSILKITQ